MISFSFPEATPMTAVATITSLVVLAIPALPRVRRIMHSKHFVGVAYLDVLAVVGAACALSYLLGWPLGLTEVGLFSLGLIVHRLARISTPVDRWLFPMTDGKNWRDIVAEGCVQYGGAR